MTIAEKIYDAARILPQDVQQEILDFTLFLTQKQNLEDAEVMEDIRTIVAENLPALKALAKGDVEGD